MKIDVGQLQRGAVPRLKQLCQQVKSGRSGEHLLATLDLLERDLQRALGPDLWREAPEDGGVVEVPSWDGEVAPPPVTGQPLQWNGAMTADWAEKVLALRKVDPKGKEPRLLMVLRRVDLPVLREALQRVFGAGVGIG